MKPKYWDLVSALNDLLSTEECVCIDAEMQEGTCSICTYNKMLDACPRKSPKNFKYWEPKS